MTLEKMNLLTYIPKKIGKQILKGRPPDDGGEVYLVASHILRSVFINKYDSHSITNASSLQSVSWWWQGVN